MSYKRLDEVEFDTEQEERSAVIDVLLGWYPYPRRVWTRMSTSQLWAIWYKGKPLPKEEKIPEPTKAELEEMARQEEWDREHPRFKTVDGVDYILTDNGEYTEIED